MNTEHTIRALQGADFYDEPSQEVRAPGLIILGLCIAAWIAFIGAGYAIWGAGYAIWRAVEALAG